MNDFNELFKQAAKTADHREKIFNQLIEKTKNETLPKFCESCRGLGVKKIYLDTKNCILADNSSEAVYDEYHMQFRYYTCVNVKSNQIQDAKYSYDDKKYYVPSNWPMLDFKAVKFTRCGIVEFIKKLNQHLTELIEAYNKKNEIAETLI